jgi:hypothetical protein
LILTVANVAQSNQAPPEGTPLGARERRRRRLLPAMLALLVGVIVIAVIVIGGGSGSGPPDTAAARLVPSDALAYVSLSLDRGRPAVKQALAVAGRLPDFPIAGAAALVRLGAVLSGGRSADFTSQIKPWLGDEAALALLNTTTSTAGTAIVIAVKDRGAAQKFVLSQGAVARGSYRGTPLLAYPSGIELAFVGDFLVLGQDTSVRAVIDVAAGSTPSLAASAVYRRATATEPSDRVLDAYASLAGVRRLLAPQGGLIGGLGDLLYQPALEGAAIAISPTAQGARVSVHSALDPTLSHLHGSSATPFTPTLQGVMPSGASLMLDVSSLAHSGSQVLDAGAAAGVAGGIGPLLSRLGSALKSEGVNLASIVSIFASETAVAVVPHGRTPTLVVVARAGDQARVRSQLAGLEVPLAQLFQRPSTGSSSSAGSEPVFNDRQVDGVTAHQLALATGLQLDYAVFRGLVVISTSLQGIEAVAQQTHTLSSDPSFRATLGNRPKLVTAMVYSNLGQLLTLGGLTGVTQSSTLTKLRPDLAKLQALGLTTTRGAGDSSAQLSLAIH